MKSRQSGFTLVEIAIVLVLIGLLLGGVLKGQELINTAKVKNLANDFRGIPMYIYAYQDKYRALPGDDIAAVNHLGGTPPPTPGNGNGVIEVSELYRALRSIVVQETQANQTPWLARQDLIGDFAIF